MSRTSYAYRDAAQYALTPMLESSDFAEVELSDDNVISAAWLTAPFLGMSYYETAVNCRIMGYDTVLE